MTDSPRPKIHKQVKSPTEIAFGKHFSDHMLLCHLERDGEWEKPRIVPYGDLMLPPTLHAFQYATEVSLHVCSPTRYYKGGEGGGGRKKEGGREGE